MRRIDPPVAVDVSYPKAALIALILALPSVDVANPIGLGSQHLNPAVLHLLEAIYVRCCPSKLSQAPELLSKYSGREDQLLRLVQAKYCPTSKDFDPTLPTPR